MMLFSERPHQGMGESLPLQPVFPQTWSRVLVKSDDDVLRQDDDDMLKKSPSESGGSGFIIGGGDAAARVAHLEHSVRFLQEQHRLLLSGLHSEIEALRERNRDLQFQLIFNKESTPKTPAPPPEEPAESSEETRLKREVSRLEREAAASRGEARAAEARALQLQRLVDAQAEKLRTLEVKKCECAVGSEAGAETRGELRARLADAERLVRRLRGDAERQRRELQCMKNSLHASLRASGLDYGVNNYHFPQVHTPDFWREPREEYGNMSRGRSTRRPLTLPELSATGQQIHRSTVYANNHTRSRANGYEHKKRSPGVNGEAATGKSPDESSATPTLLSEGAYDSLKSRAGPIATYPELKIVVTKIIPQECVAVSNGQGGEATRARPRRHHRKHAADT